MQDIVRQIRVRLRLAMNGVVSTSMREKGLQYKLNFGVSIPKLKEIATDFPHDGELAELLWQQDVREMKILATLIHPVDTFSREKAPRWAIEAPTQEIREQYVMNLLQHQPQASHLAMSWIFWQDDPYGILGYLLYARLFMKGTVLEGEHRGTFLRQARGALELKERFDDDVDALHRAALLALKKFGRQSADQAQQVLDYLADFPASGSPEKERWYADLQFEFDYYG